MHIREVSHISDAMTLQSNGSVEYKPSQPHKYVFYNRYNSSFLHITVVPDIFVPVLQQEVSWNSYATIAFWSSSDQLFETPLVLHSKALDVREVVENRIHHPSQSANITRAIYGQKQPCSNIQNECSGN